MQITLNATTATHLLIAAHSDTDTAGLLYRVPVRLANQLAMTAISVSDGAAFAFGDISTLRVNPAKFAKFILNIN